MQDANSHLQKDSEGNQEPNKHDEALEQVLELALVHVCEHDPILIGKNHTTRKTLGLSHFFFHSLLGIQHLLRVHHSILQGIMCPINSMPGLLHLLPENLETLFDTAWPLIINPLHKLTLVFQFLQQAIPF